MTITKYKNTANKYKPDKIKILFIAESSPFTKYGEEARYFYFENITSKDFLFRGIMQVLFPDEYENFNQFNKESKKKLLNKFKQNGFFLIDACDSPINQYNTKERKNFIEQEFNKLVKKIKVLISDGTKIILIKKNIYDLLFTKLTLEGI